MTLLDRFRTQSPQKHSDPTVRLSYVEGLPLAERAAIAAIAREDQDPRVRRAAVGKLMDPAALAAIARDDGDETVRDEASGMLRDLALESFEDAGEPEALHAVDAIADPRTLAQVAKAATRDAVGIRAVERLSDGRMLGSVARHGAADAVRRAALDSLCVRGDHAELVAVALNSDFKDTAVAAVDAVAHNRADLEQIENRSRNRSAVKRARTIMREADEQAAVEAAEVAAAAARAVAENPEAAREESTPPHGDPLREVAEPAGIPAPEQPPFETPQAQPDQPAREQPEGASTIAADAALESHAAATALVADIQPLEDHTPTAEQQAEADEAARILAEQRTRRLSELIEEGTSASAEADLSAARKRFGRVRREWKELAASAEIDPALASRFAELDAQMNAREAEAREADARARREALARLHALLGRVEPLAKQQDLSLKAAERAVREVRAVLGAMPSLPSRQDYDEVMARLKGVQTSLTPRMQELREAEEWKRFANAAIQEQLCARMEALKDVQDPEAIAREVRELQQQWRASADVPRAQADVLWRRFKTAHDEVWPRVEAHFAAEAQQRAENLARKTALCEQAEALADSTNWIQTAEEIKRLQAEWKTIGPVSRGREKAIWDRFRAACDRFFTRRHDDLAQRKVVWAENLAKKEALSMQAEALAESTDWDRAAAEIRRLQAEWKTIGPVKKSRSEAIWQRFRAACDRFFSRYAQRHDVARAERIAAREAICAELEALAPAAAAEGDQASDAPPPDLLTRVRGLRSRWQQEIAARGVDPEHARALDDRFASALNRVQTQWPAAFAGTELDTGSNRRRMESLVKRMEDLATSVAGTAPVAADEALSPTTKLAAMLKEALAANTIGGKVEDDSRLRAAAEEVRQAQAAWSRIGMVPDDLRRQLSDRFHRAIRRINERVSATMKTAEAGVRASGPRRA